MGAERMDPRLSLRIEDVASAHMLACIALARLNRAMSVRPGPYPDPSCPVEKWQAADAHLRAVIELLGEGR